MADRLHAAVAAAVAATAAPLLLLLTRHANFVEAIATDHRTVFDYTVSQRRAEKDEGSNHFFV